MTMEYFVRPRIAGKNIPYTEYAKVRGSVRSNDPDGSFTEQYFNIVAGQTLEITVHSGGFSPPVLGTYTYTVTLTSQTLNTILDDINNTLSSPGSVIFSALAMAVAEDGALSLQVLAQGGNRWISVTGGTAAVALGFDYRSGAITSYGGDLSTTPHSRIGIPNDTSMLSRGENVTAESVQRIAGRLAANSDVLFSDLSRQNARLQKVSSFTISGDRTYLTPAPATRIFTGGPAAYNAGSGLSGSSTKEDLAPFFLILDTATKLPASSRVRGVVKGTPPGPPYPPCPGWLGSGNVLGISLSKQNYITVDSIPDGRTMVLAASLNADVVVGDLIEFSGATNLTPTSNEGLKWVLEAINDDPAGLPRSVLTVRPMSKSELQQMGSYVAGDGQSVTELNTYKAISESYGTINVRTGYATTNVNLMIDPPLPADGTYELWAAQPISHRDSPTWEDSRALYAVSSGPQNDLDTTENAILSAPTIADGGTTVDVGAYYVRWHGRTIKIPATSITPTSGTTGFVCWDERDCITTYKQTPTTTANGPQYPNPSLVAATTSLQRIKPLAYVSMSGATVASLWNMVAVEGAKASYTVGWGGDFPNLQKALNYALRMSDANVEGSTWPKGNYPHLELVLLSDQVAADDLVAPITASVPSLTIRGVTRKTRLVLPAATGLTCTGGHLRLENLTLKLTDIAGTVATLPNKLEMVRVDFDLTSDALGVGQPAKVLASFNGATPSLFLQDVNASVSGGIARNVVTGSKITILDSTIQYVNEPTVVDFQMFSQASVPGATSTDVEFLYAANSSFKGMRATSASHSTFITATAATSRVSFVSCYFSFDSVVPPVEGSYLLNNGLLSKFELVGCTVHGDASAAIGRLNLATRGIHISGGSYVLQPYDNTGSYSGITCTTIESANVSSVEAPTLKKNGVLIDATNSVSNIIGGFGRGLLNTVGCYSCTLTMGAPTNSLPEFVVKAQYGCGIVGNTVVTATNVQNTIAIHVSDASGSVLGNNIFMSSPNYCTGVYIHEDAADVSIGGNSLIAQGSYGNFIGIDIHGARARAYENSLQISGSPVFTTAISIQSTTSNTTVDGNTILGSTITLVSGVDATITNNRTGTITLGLATTGAVTVVGNVVTGDITSTNGVAVGAKTVVSDNIVSGYVTVLFPASSTAEVCNNIIASALTVVTDLVLGVVQSSTCLVSGNTCTDLTTGATGTAKLTVTGNTATGTIALKADAGSIAFSGNNTGAVTITYPNSASAKTSVIGNTLSSLVYTVGTSITGGTIVSGNIVLGAFTLPALSGLSSVEGNKVGGVASIISANISSCEFTNTAASPDVTLGSCTVSSTYIYGDLRSYASTLASCTIVGQLTTSLGGLFLSGCTIGSANLTQGYTNVSDCWFTGNASIGDAGTTFPSSTSAERTIISGTYFGGNLVSWGLVWLTDSTIAGTWSNAGAGSFYADQKIQAEGVRVLDTGVGSIGLDNTSEISLVSCSSGGDVTISGTNVFVSGLTSKAITSSCSKFDVSHVVATGNILLNSDSGASGAVNLLSDVQTTGYIQTRGWSAKSLRAKSCKSSGVFACGEYGEVTLDGVSCTNLLPFQYLSTDYAAPNGKYLLSKCIASGDLELNRGFSDTKITDCTIGGQILIHNNASSGVSGVLYVSSTTAATFNQSVANVETHIEGCTFLNKVYATSGLTSFIMANCTVTNDNIAAGSHLVEIGGGSKLVEVRGCHLFVRDRAVSGSTRASAFRLTGTTQTDSLKLVDNSIYNTIDSWTGVTGVGKLYIVDIRNCKLSAITGNNIMSPISTNQTDGYYVYWDVNCSAALINGNLMYITAAYPSYQPSSFFGAEDVAGSEIPTVTGPGVTSDANLRRVGKGAWRFRDVGDAPGYYDLAGNSSPL